MTDNKFAPLEVCVRFISKNIYAGNKTLARQCIRHVAEVERTVARKIKGDERREILRVLSQAKTACTKGDIAAAYQAAGKGLEMVKKTGDQNSSPKSAPPTRPAA